MHLQEFQEHIHKLHPSIWDKMKDTSLQEYYAAAQRHRQTHLENLRVVPKREPLDHDHYGDKVVVGPNMATYPIIAPGARDIEV